jgi:uncharacterized protein (TIGR02001 family)
VLRHWGGALIFALTGCIALPAWAQLGASLSFTSDYQWRGLSLSAGKPALSLNLSFDHDSGLYGGLSATAVGTAHSGVRPMGYVAYVGYARRFGDRLSWDVGLTNSETTIYTYWRYSSHYTEAYAGVTAGEFSAHVYVSPKYIGGEEATVYLDTDAAMRPAKDWRLFGHLGFLAPLGRSESGRHVRARLDTRIGVARQFGHFEARAAWSAITSEPHDAVGYLQKRQKFAIGLDYFF